MVIVKVRVSHKEINVSLCNSSKSSLRKFVIMSLSQVNVDYIVVSSDLTDFYFSIFSISILFELFVRVLKDSILQPTNPIKRQKEPLIHHNTFRLS